MLQICKCKIEEVTITLGGALEHFEKQTLASTQHAAITLPIRNWGQ